MSSAPVESAGPPSTGHKSRSIGKLLAWLLAIPVVALLTAGFQTIRAANQFEQKRREIGMAGGRCETEKRPPAWVAALAGNHRHSVFDETAIVEIGMAGAKIGDANVARITGVPDLLRLNLEESQVTSAGLKSIANLKSLQSLSLVNTEVTDLSPLSELPELRELRLDYCKKIEAAHLAALATFPKLRDLGAGGLRLKDDGIAQIARCTKLEVLNITGSTLGESGLAPLQQLKQLQTLNLSRSTFNAADLAAFRAAVPGCSVVQ